MKRILLILLGLIVLCAAIVIPLTVTSTTPRAPSKLPVLHQRVGASAPSYSVGDVISTSNGSWTNTPTSYAYQWQDCAAAGCSNISGATSQTYMLQPSDVGDTIRSVVTASNATGFESAASAQSIAVTSSGGETQPDGPPGSWSIVFDDEFANDTSLTQWGDCSWNANNVTTDPANVSLSGGYLNLKLASATDGACVTTGPPTATYNGGPSNGFQLPVGDVAEARVLFPSQGTGAGNCRGWGAWWLVGPGTWPDTGEPDVAEQIDNNMTTNYHIESSEGTNYSSPAIPPAGSWCGSWHTYDIYRNPDGNNDIYYDGTEVESYPRYNSVSSSGGTSGSEAPQQLILNLGSGGGGSGDSNPSSFPITMQVQYVRAWAPS